MNSLGETERSRRMGSALGGGSSMWWYIRMGTRTCRRTPSGVGRIGVGVGVKVAVEVGVTVWVRVGVQVGVRVGVDVAVGGGVGVEVEVGVAVAVGVSEGAMREGSTVLAAIWTAAGVDTMGRCDSGSELVRQ